MLIHDALTHYCGVWARVMGITSHPESLRLQHWEQTFPGHVQPQAICPRQSRLGGTSQKAEHQGAGQSQARTYSHQEGMARTCQRELYQQVPSLPQKYRSSLGLAIINMCPRPCSYMDLITLVHLEQTVITGDTLHADKSYLGAIQRVFMYKCLHKLLRSNVT